jgi:Uma2 family endonuclease
LSGADRLRSTWLQLQRPVTVDGDGGSAARPEVRQTRSAMREPRHHATLADLEALPEDVVGQLLEGVLVVLPRPTVGHAAVTSHLGTDLGAPFGRGRGGPGGWWFLHEPELRLGADVLVPDLAAWRRARMPVLPAATTPFLTLAPDWVCEVLSPRTASYDRIQKRRIYGREGVAFLWYVEPVERVLTAYRLVGAEFQELGSWGGDEDDRVRVPPFEAVELELRSIWAPVE